jgi:hypothetical protein
MIPECNALPAVFPLDREFPRDQFETRIVTDRDEAWRVFGHCSQCGQVWLIERADVHSRDPGFAIKIPDPARHELFVQYAYRVGDREYTANRTSFGDEPFGTYEEIAADAARRLPPGARVQVFYDPTDPRRALLERGQPRGDSRWVLFSLVFLIAGVWLCGRAFFTQ